MRGNRNVGLLIVFLLITVAMAVAFFPSVNQNVAEGLNAIAPIDTESLDGATRTIFDSISYARSIHILAMLLVGFGFLMAFLHGQEGGGQGALPSPSTCLSSALCPASTTR